LAENVYEGMYILDSGRYGRNSETVAGQIPEIIEGAGGEMLVSRLWEERRLAYPINGQRKGTYWLTYFRLDGVKLGEVERKCQLNENILRVLFLKVDPRIVDALVEHAKVGPAQASSERDAAKPKEGAAEKKDAPVAVAEAKADDKPDAAPEQS